MPFPKLPTQRERGRQGYFHNIQHADHRYDWSRPVRWYKFALPCHATRPAINCYPARRGYHHPPLPESDNARQQNSPCVPSVPKNDQSVTQEREPRRPRQSQWLGHLAPRQVRLVGWGWHNSCHATPEIRCGAPSATWPRRGRCVRNTPGARDGYLIAGSARRTPCVERRHATHQLPTDHPGRGARHRLPPA